VPIYSYVNGEKRFGTPMMFPYSEKMEILLEAMNPREQYDFLCSIYKDMKKIIDIRK
jgi:hypothetical protein